MQDVIQSTNKVLNVQRELIERILKELKMEGTGGDMSEMPK
jgi:hypothetical protein